MTGASPRSHESCKLQIATGSSLSPGTFYLFCPKPGLASSLFASLGRTVGSFGRSNSEKITQERLETLIRRSSPDRSEEKLAKGDGPLLAPTWNPSPNSWTLGGGAALVVNFGMFEAVGDLQRVEPSVYHDADHRTVCVFQGYLSNLDELIERYCDSGDGALGSPRAVAAARRDAGEAAAEVILRMYCRGDEPLVVLSELQGSYAFALCDGERRQLLAARDGGGGEPLFHSVDDDGGVSVSNARVAVPAPDGGGGPVRWAELPPGCYLAGRTPKVQQFSLTPAQLREREIAEAAEDEEASPHASSLGRRTHSGELSAPLHELLLVD